jgi:hypothetical protein
MPGLFAARMPGSEAEALSSGPNHLQDLWLPGETISRRFYQTLDRGANEDNGDRDDQHDAGVLGLEDRVHCERGGSTISALFAPVRLTAS